MITAGWVHVDYGINDDGDEVFMVTHDGIKPMTLLGLLEMAADNVKDEFRYNAEEAE